MWVRLAHLTEPVAEVSPHFHSVSDEVLVSNDLVLSRHEESPHRVTHPCVEVAERELRTELISVEETACLRLLRERYEVWPILQVPMLMCPVLPTACHTCVHLINDHVDTLFTG